MFGSWDGSGLPEYKYKYNLEINLDRALEFLTSICKELAGNAFISFEGYMSTCEPFDFPGLSRSETAILKRKAIFPILDFVVLPLEPGTVNEIMGLLADDPCLLNAIVHIEILKNNQIEFGAYDNFLPTLCGPAVARQFLDGLQQAGVLTAIREV